MSPLDPLRDHRLWWTTPLAEKCAVARSKSDFSARLPEQSDAVWTCKKSSHSIFVLIYNDIYHFVWSNKIFKKRGHSLAQLTQHMVYKLEFSVSHICVPRSVSSHLLSLPRQSVLSTFLFGHNISSPTFSNLSGRTRQVHNLFKCHTRQKDDGARLLMAK